MKDLDSIYFTALELPLEDRAAWLTQACGDDDALRARVEQMLAVADKAEAFMGDPDGAAATVLLPSVVMAGPSGRPGDRIGHYKLLQCIGEGGFGTVWMAEQMEPVSRRVALKIIKLGMDTQEVIARFEAERQALAIMDHPNIARVFDAGATDTGRPYFVMELVKGMPITQFCDEQQLGTRERLALFGDVCSAINHAHQKGVIHRDIKPSNVMVSLYADKPVVKVIDFGIAKATQGKLTDKTLFTRFEQFIGTPVYMSPEQAALSTVDIDTRSDIYSLGILLYELLTGKPPFDAKTLAAAGYEEMRRIIREVEPPKPSSRLSTVAGEARTTLAKARRIEPDKLHRLVEPDLDWIVMKAIEKDRARRYETANGLALDIQRFLADEPVSATPPSAGYRFRKFARRNKTALRVAAGIAAVLVAATAVSIWQAVRATNAEIKTAGERDAKELARQDAEAIAKFFTEVFESPDPGRDGYKITVASTLVRAAAKLDADRAIPPYRRARLQDMLGLSCFALGMYPEAIRLQEKVRDFYLATAGPEHPDTLSTMGNLGAFYSADGRKDEALKMREEVLTLFREANGPEHPDTLKAMTNLALSWFAAGRRDEAIGMQEKVLALSRKLHGPEHPETLGAMGNLANSYADAGRRDETLKLREEALPLFRKVRGPGHPDTLSMMAGLADSWYAAGRRDEALKMREEVLPLYLKMSGPEHPATLLLMNTLANSYFSAGRKDEALRMSEELLTLRRKLSGPENPATLSLMGNVATFYFNTGRRDEALQQREEMLPLCRKAFGLEHPATLSAMTNLAVSWSAAGRKDEALKMNEEVLTLRSRVSGPEHPDTLRAMNNLADSYSDARRVEEALKMHEEALTLSRKVNGPEHPDTLAMMASLSVSYGQAGRLPEAIAIQEQSLAPMRRVLPSNHPHFATALSHMAELYDKTGRKDEAAALRKELAGAEGAADPAPARATLQPAPVLTNIKALEAALELARKDHGPEHADTIAAMTALAAANGADGDGRKAIKLGEEALALARRVLPAGDQRLVKAMKVLADLYRLVDREDEARKLEAEMPAPVPERGPNK